MEVFNNVNSIFRYISSSQLKKGDVVIDATVGNGNDIIFLMDIVGKDGYGYGFDIQELAVENTLKKIKTKEYSNSVRIIKDSHENVDLYVDKKVDMAVFNLGYLPKADHSIITKAYSTIKSIEKIIPLLNKKGIIVISSYIGHCGGMEEYKCIKKFVESINQKEYNVINLEFLNQKNNPPKLIVIEKRG